MLNKCDLVSDDRTALRERFAAALDSDAPAFVISGATGEGCRELCYAVMEYLEEASNAQVSE